MSMNPYMPYTPYMPQDAYMQDQMALRQRIDNLSQAQQQYKAQPQPNVNWIQVTGIDGARNQIVQPGTTAWMMDNNAPYFYVKSVDGVGSVTFKAFEFHEVQANNPQPVVENHKRKYIYFVGKSCKIAKCICYSFQSDSDSYHTDTVTIH